MRPGWLLRPRPELLIVLCQGALLTSACASGDSRDDSSTGSGYVTAPMSSTGNTSGASANTGAASESTDGVDASSSGGDGPVCGDGVVEGDEVCDDGNTVDEDACLGDCSAEASCGDGVVWAGQEECDDGNDDESDGCSSSCKASTCGNGTVEGDEQCDDGNTDNDDSCLDTCAPASCGDGYVWSGDEACDDAGESATCNEDCTEAACGDGIANASAGEACDDAGESATCNDDCTEALCGDGVLNELAGEVCDDGNTDEGDGCDANCTFETDPVCNEPYNVLDAASRNKNTFGEPYVCDSDPVDDWVGAGWYRFQGAAGTQMATSTVPPNSCGTNRTGYLNTEHPEIAEGVVSGQVCFNWNGNICASQSIISVVNCGDFYLYSLPNVLVCNGRYCGSAD